MESKGYLYVPLQEYRSNSVHYEKEAKIAGKSLYITMTPAELEESESIEPNFKLLREMNERLKNLEQRVPV